MTLDMLEHLQDRLLAGDESYLDSRLSNTVNSMMASLMAFVRFYKRHRWIDELPPLEKLPVDDVMKGRPISGEEFERMLEATSVIVGEAAEASWKFALRILWESGFRIGDLMDFHWEDDRHIHPVWPTRRGHHPTIVVPSSQKNGKSEEIPMLPGLRELLESVPKSDRTGWVVNLDQVDRQPDITGFRPADDDLQQLSRRYSNRSIAAACGVSDVSVRTWLLEAGVRRTSEFKQNTGRIPTKEIAAFRQRSTRRTGQEAPRPLRPTKEHVSRVIADIGEKAGVIVRRADEEKGVRIKYASAHDLRRGSSRFVRVPCRPKPIGVRWPVPGGSCCSHPPAAARANSARRSATKSDARPSCSISAP
jgi:hypothetical protein